MSGLLRQATCVAIHGRGLLIEGRPDSGKSSLALALIDRGAVLVGDDGVALEVRGGRIWALPAPATRGLIEIRNVGIVEMPSTEAPVCLLVTLDEAAPRFVEAAGKTAIAGCAVPSLALWPDSPVLALRAEAALARYGLPPA